MAKKMKKPKKAKRRKTMGGKSLVWDCDDPKAKWSSGKVKSWATKA